nr:transporter substrate-binding domain-containing protein [Rugamonas sp. CCM 8940]
MKRGFLACALLCCIAAPRAATHAPFDCGDIAVAFYEHGALYYRDGNGRWTGIDKDIIDELGKRLGCRFHGFVDSRVRIWTNLKGNTLPMSVSGLATPERLQFARFVPYFTARNYVLLQKNTSPAVHDLASFLAEPSYKVAVIKSFKHGATFEPWLSELRRQGRVYETADYSSLMRLFKLGRVQAVLALNTSWAPLVRQRDLGEGVKIMDWAPKDVIVGGLVLSRQLIPEATAEQFALALHAMREDGTLRAIFTRHVGAELAAGMFNF